MARHLCIVARDNSPLYGFLTIAFRDRPAGADTLDVVLDRRRADTAPERGRPAPHSDRRRHVRVHEALRTRGYAIIAGPGGTPRASDEAFIERAVGILADVERRGPLALRFPHQGRTVRRAVVRTAIVAVIVLAVIGVLATLPRIGGLARVTDDVGRWTDVAVGRLEQAWTTFSGATVAPSTAHESEREGRPLPPSPSPSAATLPSPSPTTTSMVTPASDPARAEPARTASAVALPPASSRPAPLPDARVTRELTRVAEPNPGTLMAARTPAPRAAPAAETARPAAGDTPPRETQSRNALPREGSPPGSAPREEASDAADGRSLVTFAGLPRVELSRQPSTSGSGIVYTVRLADTGGGPVAGAQVWMRGHSADGQARETRLDAVDPPGTYRSGPLPVGALPPPLSVRVFFSNMRVEVPVEP